MVWPSITLVVRIKMIDAQYFVYYDMWRLNFMTMIFIFFPCIFLMLFWLLLIRYLKRGVNEKGRVANDVETEQIVFEEIPGGTPTHFCSVVQNRGSIPLFWSQETSKLNLKPDIVCKLQTCCSMLYTTTHIVFHCFIFSSPFCSA